MSAVRTVPCTIIDVRAGDRLVLKLRLGWGVELTTPVRLAGVLAMDPAGDEGAAQKAELRQAVASLRGEEVQLSFMSLELDQHEQSVGQLFVTDAQGVRHDFAAQLLVGEG